MSGIEITDVRIYPFDTSESGGKSLAMADISIGGALVIKGFRVIQAKNGGLFVGFPSTKAKDGQWRDTVYTLNTDTKTLIRDTIISAYKSSQ